MIYIVVFFYLKIIMYVTYGFTTSHPQALTLKILGYFYADSAPLRSWKFIARIKP